MGDASGRIHLLLVAFAVFFAVAHGTSDRHRAPLAADGFAAATAFDAADHSRDQAPVESGHQAHESVAELQPLTDPGPCANERVPARGTSESRTGRVVGFGDTPPPRAA